MMPSRIRNARLPGDQLSIYCWCMAEIIYVPLAVVQACRTASCGRRGCAPPT